jgi:hypothetical protein
LLFFILVPISGCDFSMLRKEERIVRGKLMRRDIKIARGGEYEYITLWDCGEYGFHISDNRKLFRTAKDNELVKIYRRNGDWRMI